MTVLSNEFQLFVKHWNVKYCNWYNLFSFSGQKNENQSTKKVGLSSLHNFASALQPCFPYNDLHRSMRCLSFFCMVAVRDTSTSHRLVDDFFCRNISYQTKSHKNIEITEFWVIKNLLLLLYIINFLVLQDSAPKPMRQVTSWSTLSNTTSGGSRTLSSASSFEKFKQQARDKEERVCETFKLFKQEWFYS